MKKNHLLKTFFLGILALAEVVSFKVSAGKTQAGGSGLQKEKKLENGRQEPQSIEEILGGILQFDEFHHDSQRSNEQLMKDYLKFVSFYFAKERIDMFGHLSQTNAEMIGHQFVRDAHQMLGRFFRNREEQEAFPLFHEETMEVLLEEQKKGSVFADDVLSAISFLKRNIFSLLRLGHNEQPLPTDDEVLRKKQLDYELRKIAFQYLIDLSGTKIWKPIRGTDLKAFARDLLQAFQRYFDNYSNGMLPKLKGREFENFMKEKVKKFGSTRKLWNGFQGLINRINAVQNAQVLEQNKGEQELEKIVLENHFQAPESIQAVNLQLKEFVDNPARPNQDKEEELHQVQNAQVLEQNKGEQKLEKEIGPENHSQAPESIEEILDGTLNLDELPHNLKRSDEEKKQQIVKDYLQLVSFYFKDRKEKMNNLKATNAQMVIDLFDKDLILIFHRFLATGQEQEKLPMNFEEIRDKLLKMEERGDAFAADIWRFAFCLRQGLSRLLGYNINNVPMGEEESKKKRISQDLVMVRFKHMLSLDGEKIWKSFDLKDCEQDYTQAFSRYFDNYQNEMPPSLTPEDLEKKIAGDRYATNVRNRFHEFKDSIAAYQAQNAQILKQDNVQNKPEQLIEIKEKQNLGNKTDFKIGYQIPQFAQKPQILKQDNVQNKSAQLIEIKEKQNLGNKTDFKIGYQIPQFAQKPQILEQDDKKKEKLLQIDQKNNNNDEFFAKPTIKDPLMSLIERGVVFDKLQNNLSKKDQLKADWVKVFSFYFKANVNFMKQQVRVEQMQLIRRRFAIDSQAMLNRFLDNKAGGEEGDFLTSILLGLEFSKAAIDGWFIRSIAPRDKKSFLFHRLNAIGFKHFIDQSAARLWNASIDAIAFKQDIAHELQRYFQDDSVHKNTEALITMAKNDPLIREEFNGFMRRLPVDNL